jgi:hypothetical protein
MENDCAGRPFDSIDERDELEGLLSESEEVNQYENSSQK